MYDSNGNYVMCFDKVSDCSEFLSKSNYANINRAIKCGYKVSGYFVTDQKLDSIKIQITKNNGKLNRYSLNGDYIDSFETVSEARQKLGLKLCSISAAIRKKGMCNGYY